MLTKPVVIISQYTYISNHCTVHLKLIQCYTSVISQLLKIFFNKLIFEKRAHMFQGRFTKIKSEGGWDVGQLLGILCHRVDSQSRT